MARLALLTRSVCTLVRILEFLIAALVLGIFSYYLGFLSKHSMQIPNYERAIEGMSGAAVLYTIFAILLTFFLGGITIFAFIAVVLDVCFCGCFVAISILTRGGDYTCGGINDSPIGPGQYQSCQLQRAVFAVSIAAAILFLLSAVLQVALSRHHKKEKRYGPSPSNNYTSGSGKRAFWGRKNRKNRDAELATVGATGALAAEEGGHHHHTKHHDTTNGVNGVHDATMTGTTLENGTGHVYGGPEDKYTHREPTLPATGHVTGYTPQGTGYQSTGYTPQTSGVTGGGMGTSVPEMSAVETHHGVVHQDGALGGGGYVH